MIVAAEFTKINANIGIAEESKCASLCFIKICEFDGLLYRLLHFLLNNFLHNR